MTTVAKTLIDMGLTEEEGLLLADLVFPEAVGAMSVAAVIAGITGFTRNPSNVQGATNQQRDALGRAGRKIRQGQRAGQLPDPPPRQRPRSDGSEDVKESKEEAPLPIDPAGAQVQPGTGLPPIVPYVGEEKGPAFVPASPELPGETQPLLGPDHPVAEIVRQDELDALERERERMQDIADVGGFIAGGVSAAQRVIEIGRQIKSIKDRIRGPVGGVKGPGPVKLGDGEAPRMTDRSQRRLDRRVAQQPVVSETVEKRSTRRTLRDRQQGFSNVNVMQQAHANYMQALGRWNTTFSRSTVQFPESANFGQERAKASIIDMGLGSLLVKGF